jgi:hypothetical protein
MDQNLSESGTLAAVKQYLSEGCCVHVLVSSLMLSAGLLSIITEISFAPVTEGQSTVYLAMQSRHRA